MRAVSLVLAAALCLAAQVPSQSTCSTPQGNAKLVLSGLPNLGDQFNLSLTGRPKAPFWMLWDKSPGPLKTPWGTVCVGNIQFLVGGAPFFTLPPWTGNYRLDLRIPEDQNLIGQSLFFQGLVLDDQSPSKFLAFSNGVGMKIDPALPIKTVFFEDFEAPHPGWYTTQGVWELGTPTNKIGPATAFSGVGCAGTDLDAQYPHTNVDSRLVSPPMALPFVKPQERILASFRLWNHTEDYYDYVRLEVSPDQRNWQIVTTYGPLQGSFAQNNGMMTGSSTAWTRMSADLTKFAGYSKLYFAFRFVTRLRCDCCRCYPAAGHGVYVDDFHVFTGQPPTWQWEDWEAGIGNFWKADNGVWQVGKPTVGPSQTPSGTQCAGTFLDGKYPESAANSRLISPPVRLPGFPPKTLRFTEWVDTELGYDYGEVQVSNDDGKTWTTVSISPHSTGRRPAWSTNAIPLNQFAGETVRIAFYFGSGLRCDCCRCYPEDGAGWYLDDIRIE